MEVIVCIQAALHEQGMLLTSICREVQSCNGCTAPTLKIERYRGWEACGPPVQELPSISQSMTICQEGWGWWEVESNNWRITDSPSLLVWRNQCVYKCLSTRNGCYNIQSSNWHELPGREGYLPFWSQISKLICIKHIMHTLSLKPTIKMSIAKE